VLDNIILTEIKNDICKKEKKKLELKKQLIRYPLIVGGQCKARKHVSEI